MSYLASAALAEDAPSTNYPFALPAVRALTEPGLQFGPVTVLVGANGSGKSTLVEALAVATGFNAEGGSRNLMFETNPTHSELSEQLIIQWDRRPKWGWFLRAETFYGMATHIERDADLRPYFPDLHARSHGESFLEIINDKMKSDGLYFLDEPESALSFHGQLSLMHAMHAATQVGAQFIVATHSPILMAFPEAAIFELNEDGPARVAYDDVEAVRLWRSFLDSPSGFFRHLFTEPPSDAV